MTALTRAMATLAADGVTAEVARALRAETVGHMLLKGPTIAGWLYDAGELRAYSDVDVLVEPGRLGDAERVLTGLGFHAGGVAKPPARGLAHSEPWRRAGGPPVDVHRTFFGAAAPPEDVWRALQRDAVTMRVAGEDVAAPGLPARALLVALHAAQHGPEVPHPIEDLRRAVARAGEETWRAAALLAEAIEVAHTMAEGLRLIPAGAELAARLALVDPALLDASATPLVLGIERLASRRGARAKARLLARELAPSPDFLRWSVPLARRGRRGLVAAYLLRPLWLAWHAPRSLLAWRRARRQGS